MPDLWQRVEENSWLYNLAEIALRRVTDEVVAAIFSSQQCGFHDLRCPIQELIATVSEFKMQLDAWHESLPYAIAFPIDQQPLQNELQYFLRLRYILISELLHRPFIHYAVHNPTSTSTEVHDLAEVGLAFALDYLLQSNYTHRHHGKWLQLRRGLAESCILLAASENHLRMPRGWQEGLTRAKTHMRYWAIEAPMFNSYLEVISAVKNHFVGI